MQQKTLDQVHSDNYVNSINNAGVFIKEAYSKGFRDGSVIPLQQQIEQLKQMIGEDKGNYDAQDVIKYLESLLTGGEIYDFTKNEGLEKPEMKVLKSKK